MDSVMVLGQKFTIEYKTIDEMPDELGICNVTNNTIFLRQGMIADKFREVLLHEVIHAIAEDLNMNLKENQVNNLAVGVYDFLKHNNIEWK